jgi:hypothetical protein
MVDTRNGHLSAVMLYHTLWKTQALPIDQVMSQINFLLHNLFIPY